MKRWFLCRDCVDRLKKRSVLFADVNEAQKRADELNSKSHFYSDISWEVYSLFANSQPYEFLGYFVTC